MLFRGGGSSIDKMDLGLDRFGFGICEGGLGLGRSGLGRGSHAAAENLFFFNHIM